MKIKILKPGILVGEFVVNEYDIHLPHLRFNIKNKGFYNTDDCVITELPKSFCVKSCDDGIKWGKYIDWLNKTYNTDFCGRLFNFDNPSDNPYYGVIDGEGWGIKIPFGTEIHIDDMIKHIDYMERHIKGGEQFHKESQLTVKMETQRLSREGLKEIYSVACDEWQGKLKSFGYRNPLENYIDLTYEEVNEMFFASNDKQKSILSKYLKQDDGSVDVTKFNVNGNGFYVNNHYIIRDREIGKYKRKSFLLSSKYNWEIKEDEIGELCLIPTKKK